MEAAIKKVRETTCMKIIAASHADHGLTAGQVEYIKNKFKDRREFFKETIGLPPELGFAPCNIVGPAVAMPPIPETDVGYRIRGDRHYASRIWLGLPNPEFTPSVNDARMRLPIRPPLVNQVTVIAGPYKKKCGDCDGRGHNCIHCEGWGDKMLEPCVLYTAYGGPLAPREPGDPDIKSWEELEESRQFWSEHALLP